ncbi:SdpI family protein [Anaerocolumna sp. AGMB13020]|uniref:SdpI family protein n=1 Tax=Anaerocolumna sp. AGMB13020 TaxID=3081750 RepID=UPI002953C298|nr:SdpI family protein [Anaerocolumna sp. AGMB13020]WOO37311.1 SdpI family protein [Anaerocolumna sp. AGMB13020]
MLFIFLSIWIFIALPLLMAFVCISMNSSIRDNRNKSAGYRTKASLKSQSNWNMANTTFGYCSFLIALLEIITLILTYKVLIPRNLIDSGVQSLYINSFVFILSISGSIIFTELKLKKYIKADSEQH